MKETVRVALIQAKPYPELDDPRNVGHAIRLLERCQGKNVDVACFPEYFPWAGEEILSDMARKLRCYLVAGLVEVVGAKLFSTATLFDRRGHMVGRQRKSILGRMESQHLGIARGGDTYRVFDTDFARVGLPLGIDFWGQTEAARTLTEQGADLIINQGIFPILRGQWKYGALVRAFDNFIPVVGVNTADFNRRVGGKVFRHQGGHSMTIQPPKLLGQNDFTIWLRGLDSLEGWVTAKLDRREQVYFAEVDLGTTGRFRSELWRHLGFERHRIERKERHKA